MKPRDCQKASLLTRQRRCFPVPFKSPPKGGQQIPARDFRAHSLAELKTKIKMRNADFYALSGFVQGIHGILFLYREMELIDPAYKTKLHGI